MLLGFTLAGPLNAAEKKIDLKTNKDKMSYIMGIQIANLLRRQNIEPDIDIMVQAIKESLDNQPPRISPEEAERIMKEPLNIIKATIEEKARE